MNADTDALEKSFRDFTLKVGNAFRVAYSTLSGGYTVDEIQLQVKITAEGSFGIIVGGRAGAAGGITVVLRRPATSLRTRVPRRKFFMGSVRGSPAALRLSTERISLKYWSRRSDSN